MGVPSNLIAQMLMQGGGQGGGMAPGGLQTNNGAQAGADLVRKIMMIRALQGQQPQQPGQPPQQQSNIMGQVAAQPQVMQAQQLPGGINA